MKKLLNKIRKKGNQPTEAENTARITTDTLAVHREKVLAGGRKFKYPLQYQKHKLVFNTIIIATVAVLILVGLGWYLLYKAQNTSEFIYRVTKIIPIPVAVVDGQQVRYSSYLMQYRSNLHYLVEKEQVNVSSKDGQSLVDYIKDKSISDAIADAYAQKLAKQMGISVSDAELEEFLTQQRQSSDGTDISEDTYNTVIKDYYGWSPDEYKEAMLAKLLRQKVAYAVDDSAKDIADGVAANIKAGATDLNALSESINTTNKDATKFIKSQWVPKNNRDGGLASAASKLQKGQISTAIKTVTGDGYYFVKLDDINDTQVQYEYIFIPLKAFDSQLAELKAKNKITRYIDIPSQDLTQPPKGQ